MQPSSPAGARRSFVTGVLFASTGAIALSGKAIIVKLCYRHGVDAVTVLMYRMLFSLPLFLTLSGWAGRGKPAPQAGDWRMLLGLGFSGYYLASFLDFAGLQYIGASLERLILYLNPTIVLILGSLLFKTRIRPRQWLALAVSYLGMLLVFGREVSVGGPHLVLGTALVFGSALSYALYLGFSGEAVKRLGALRVTGLATSIACVLCIAQFFVLRTPSTMEVAPAVLWLSLLNAVVCTFVPVLLVMLAIERVGAGIAAQAGMIGPLSTIALSALLLGEVSNIWMAAGTALVLAGVWPLARQRMA